MDKSDLKTARGFDLAAFGKFASIPFLTADIGNLAGGAFSAALIRAGAPVRRAKRIAVLFFSLLMTSAIPAVLTENVWVSFAFISTATFGYAGCTANMLPMPADYFPKNSVASIYGLASMGSGFGGMLFSLVTGWLVDRYSFVPAFWLFGSIPVIAAALVWRLPHDGAARSAGPVPE